MRVLGIETSCDETSAAVVEGDGATATLRSLVIVSQDVHRLFGGVVPEIASRAHLTSLVPAVRQALVDANMKPAELDAVAVTYGPGLVGALLVGVSWAKAYAATLEIPVLGVHHMEGHLFAMSLEDANAEPPFTALLVSGGHTLLLDVPAWGEYKQLGATRDDAAGEAFDKVAKLLGLPYPGGPHVERLAASVGDSGEGGGYGGGACAERAARNRQRGDDRARGVMAVGTGRAVGIRSRRVRVVSIARNAGGVAGDHRGDRATQLLAN